MPSLQCGCGQVLAFVMGEGCGGGLPPTHDWPMNLGCRDRRIDAEVAEKVRDADCYCLIASRAHYVPVAETVRVADCYCLIASRANHASSRASHLETAIYRA